MKKLGIIGGMSWESTQTYYAHLNREIRGRLGGLHSVSCVLHSFDFAEIAAYQAEGDWQRATDEMISAGLSLKQAGADCLLIATNTMHKMAEQVEQAADLPLLHIADATAAAITAQKVKNPLLLATEFTMSQDFYKGRLAEKHGVHVTVPSQEDRSEIHRIIYQELCQGEILSGSKQTYCDMIARYQESQGIDGVIFGCTEIGLLISQDDVSIPAFDTTKIHCDYAIDYILSA